MRLLIAWKGISLFPIPITYFQDTRTKSKSNQISFSPIYPLDANRDRNLSQVGWTSAATGPLSCHRLPPGNRMPLDLDAAATAQSQENAHEAPPTANGTRWPAGGSPRMDSQPCLDVAQQLSTVRGLATDHRARPEIPNERKGALPDELRHVLKSSPCRR